MAIEIVNNYRDKPQYRQGFFELLPQVFPGVSFVEWHKRGCWDDNYHTYGVYNHHTNQMLANVAVGLMNIWVEHQLLRGLQFSAVATLPEARKKGYSRQLMELILKKYADETELFFLFANPSVVDFYPLFGFRQVEEHFFRMAYPANVFSDFSATRLDVNNKQDWEVITHFTAHRKPLTQIFGVSGEENILNWSLLYSFNQNIYYLRDKQLIIVAEELEGVLNIYDILSLQPLETLVFWDILPCISYEGVHTIEFQFTPEKLKVETQAVAADKESPLFIKGAFKVEGKPFKFPVMAQT